MPNTEPKLIFQAIQEADPIVIVAHVNPDPDANGSQMGLKEAILDQYPEKTVLTIGQGNQFDVVDDETIKNALVIITDTSNKERVDDQRYALGKKIARFDHHVRVEDFGNLDYVDVWAAAACEVEALLMKQEGWKISAKAAQHLLTGLISDTQRFSIPTVRAETFEAAAWLASQGADANQACIELFTSSFEAFHYTNRVRQRAVRKENLIFSVMGCQDYLSLGFPYEEAKNFVNPLSNIEGIELWALFTEQPDGLYAASLRSKKRSIVELAAQFGGGGHQCACGIKNLPMKKVQELIEACALLSK